MSIVGVGSLCPLSSSSSGGENLPEKSRLFSVKNSSMFIKEHSAEAPSMPPPLLSSVSPALKLMGFFQILGPKNADVVLGAQGSGFTI